eukprot:3456621-Pyramimonas_sp.AAC.1
MPPSNVLTASAWRGSSPNGVFSSSRPPLARMSSTGSASMSRLSTSHNGLAARTPSGIVSVKDRPMSSTWWRA